MLMELTLNVATEGFSKSCFVEETCNELLFLQLFLSMASLLFKRTSAERFTDLGKLNLLMVVRF